MSSEINRFDNALQGLSTQWSQVQQQLKSKNAQIRDLEKRVASLTDALAEANKSVGVYKERLLSAVQTFKKMFPQEENSPLPLQERVTLYEAKLKESPVDPEVLFELGVAYYELGDYQKALGTFTQLDKKTNWLVSHYMARICTRLNQQENALAHIDCAIRLETNGINYALMAHIAIQSKLADTARAAIDQAKGHNFDVTKLEEQCACLQ